MQTGFDSATGTYLQNIVGSTYGVEKGLTDDSGILPPLPDILNFAQNNLAEGKYTVQVIGTGTGSYTLDFAVGSGPGNSSLQTVAGITTPGNIDTLMITSSMNQPLNIQFGQALSIVDTDNSLKQIRTPVL